MTSAEKRPDDSAPDVYFTDGYGQAEEACGSGERLDLRAFDGRWRMPVHLRTVNGFVDAVSPYGYSGIYADSELSVRDRERAWNDAASILLERKVLSVFLRQSPLVSSGLDTGEFEAVVQGHTTFCVDTTCSDAVWTSMEGRSRTSIRKAERAGYTVNVEAATHSDIVAGSSFRHLYEAGMHRKAADSRYFFPDAYYERLLSGLGENLYITSVIDESGTPVSMALLMRHGSMLHYHLSGSIAEAGRNGATNLMIWGAANWAARNGIFRFHLGGGVSQDDSLSKFKRSFGGQALSYSAYGRVIDEVGYGKAVSLRARQLGCSTADLAERRFFPQFRTDS